MLHLIETDNVYYNRDDHCYYFINDHSRFDNKVLEVDENLKLVDKVLPENKFSVVRRKRGYLALEDEDLSTKCLYFGEVFEKPGSKISLDSENTSCKVVACYIAGESARFAVVLSRRNFFSLDVANELEEPFKFICTYYFEKKQVLAKTLSLSKWEEVTKSSQMVDYDDQPSVEVNFELLSRLKETGFRFTKYFNK